MCAAVRHGLRSGRHLRQLLLQPPDSRGRAGGSDLSISLVGVCVLLAYGANALGQPARQHSLPRASEALVRRWLGSLPTRAEAAGSALLTLAVGELVLRIFVDLRAAKRARRQAGEAAAEATTAAAAATPTLHESRPPGVVDRGTTPLSEACLHTLRVAAASRVAAALTVGGAVVARARAIHVRATRHAALNPRLQPSHMQGLLRSPQPPALLCFACAPRSKPKLPGSLSSRCRTLRPLLRVAVLPFVAACSPSVVA